MNKNIIYITDSSMLQISQESSFYSIISLNGSIEAINRIAHRSYEIFGNSILSEKSFCEWYKIDENSNILFDFLVYLYNECSECVFTTYLSDHDYSKFLLYINTFISMNDNAAEEIIKRVDVLYQNFDINLLQSFNNDISKDKLIELNAHFMKLLKSKIPYEAINTIQSVTNPLEKQMEHILSINNMLWSDLSVVDYLHYSASLINLINEYAINTICAPEHSVKNINLCISAQHHLAESTNDAKLEYHVITDFKDDHIGVLLKNILVICHSVWNQLHISDSIDKLSQRDKWTITYLWLLFQSKYSSWMITNADFDKIKQILEEIKEQND